MENILLANIGNRSLIFKQKPKDAETIFVGDINNSFREVTNQILDKKDYSNVRINILDQLLEYGNLKNTINSVYLFTSKQGGKDNSQKRRDTEHAGEIIAELIKSEYKIENVKTECLEGVSVIDSEALIKWYRNFFQAMPKENVHFIICDSGGTPQQKTSLKLVAEYFLNEKDYDYYQIIEPSYEEGELGESKVIPLSESKKNEYRNIIAAQQVGLLIEKGNYAAAAALLNKNNIVVNALNYCSERLNGITSNIPNRSLKQDFPETFTFTYSKYQEWSDIFKQEDEYAFVCEALSIADFYLGIEDWTRFVLATQNFIERFAIKFLLNKLIPQQTEDEIENNIMSLNQKLKRINQLIVEIDNLHNIHDVFSKFKECHSSAPSRGEYRYKIGLDKLRNKIAHNGIGVKDFTDITAQVPDILVYLTDWKNKFGLPGINVFITANDEICKVLKEQ